MAKIFSFLFCFILFSQLIMSLFSASTTTILTGENRNPTPFPVYPQTSLPNYIKQIESYVADSVPQRMYMINFYLYLMEWVLHTPQPSNVRGKQYGLYKNHLLMQHSFHVPHPSDFNVRLAIHVGRKAIFSKYNIPYLLTIPPDKESVLADDIAWWFPTLEKDNSFKLFLSAFEENNIPVLNMGKYFANSPNRALFYNKKHDVYHWNINGYLFGMNLLTKELEKILQRPLPEMIEFTITKVVKDASPHGQDIVPQIEWESAPLNTEVYHFVAENYINGPSSSLSHKIINLEGGDGSLVVISDSYFNSLGPRIKNIISSMLSVTLPFVTNFKYTYSLDQDQCSYEAIKQIVALKPSVVVDEVCEREMLRALPINMRISHFKVLLLGEKVLGNLKYVLTPDMLLEYQKITNTSPIPNKKNNVLFSSITTNDAGYAALAINLEKSIPMIHYRRKGSTKWLSALSYTSQRNVGLYYFQITDEKNTELEIKVEFNNTLDKINVLPMDFLNEIEGKESVI